MSSTAAPHSSILIVDDDPAVRSSLRLMLQHGGYSVSEAADGRQALEQLTKSRFEMILIDLIMPEQEGLETITALKRQHPGVKVIAISGALPGTFLRIAKYLGADEALPKPIRTAELLATVRRVLE